MRFIWMIFVGLAVLMVALLPRLGHHDAAPVGAPASFTMAPVTHANSPTTALPFNSSGAGRADSIVAFGLAQQGTPYVWAGTSPLTGFDCSGFLLYTYGHFGVAVPHSTALLIDAGRPVARTEAQPGDIVVFTGTAANSSTPGHAGIVISGRGERPLRFVHASSSRREPFVKVSQVEGTDYERRFMQVRRVLGPARGMVAMAQPAAASPSRTAPVAALPVRPVLVKTTPVPSAKLPKALPTRKLPAAAVKHPATKPHVGTKMPAAAREMAVSRTKATAKKSASKKPVVKKKLALPVRRK